MISDRAKVLLGDEPPLVKAHFTCSKSPYSKNNIDGYINLGTAENFLMDNIIKEKLKSVANKLQYPFHYDYPSGSESLRKTFVSFSEKYFSINNLDYNNIVIASGASALLEMITYVLCNDGDSILMLNPLYCGFFHDLEFRFQGQIVTSEALTSNGFDIKIFEDDIKNNEGLKNILINNPHNPTGLCLNSNEIKSIIKIGKKYKIEIIVDEIYGNSVYGDEAFKSFLHEDFDSLDYKNNIHLIYGMAKDFCMSGLKVGFFSSNNEDVAKAMSALAYFHTVSTQTQLLAENILADHKYCTDFFKESGLRLHKLKNYLDKKLETIGIKKYPSISGVFTWIDLREKFNIITFEDELKIFEMMLEKGRFNITPGQFFGASKPGQFRICFAKSEADIDEFITRVDALSL